MTTVPAVAPPVDMAVAHWQIVQGILQKHVPHCAVWAFGSRAKGAAKPYSDLDLVIIAAPPLSLDAMAALREDFVESALPWTVDLLDWASTSEAFREVVLRDKVVVQAPS